LSLTNTFASLCHYSRQIFGQIFLSFAVCSFLVSPAIAQLLPMVLPQPDEQARLPVEPNAKPARVPGANGALAEDDIVVRFVSQEIQLPNYRYRGNVSIETFDGVLKADEIDYNEETGYAEARGNVYYRSSQDGNELWADRAEYNVNDLSGKFFNVRGSSPVRIDARPGILTSTNPFVFEGKWAERLKDRYILHEGFVTSCKLPRPWWRLTGRRFEIVPGERAIAQNSTFRLRNAPIFFTPYFYKSLAKQPRRSGFTTPKFGSSSRFGFVYGLGYYWAINRSHDVLYQTYFLTQRGFAHEADLRGKPRVGTDYYLHVWGINDRGRIQQDGSRAAPEGGYSLDFTGKTEIGRGWYGRATVKYISSFRFRQAFTQTFTEAIGSEINSVGFLAKHWNFSSFHAVAARQENFQSAEPDDKISIRRLPQFEWITRDRPLKDKLPAWFSLEATGGFVRRNQPLFQTRQYVERFDAAPRLMTAMHWKDFHIVPSFGVRGTYWGSSRPEGAGLVTGRNATRFARDAQVDVIFPSLAKVMDSPFRWAGTKWKHVIEPRATYRHVSGIADFNKLIRFDEIELLSNTHEAEAGLANRIFTKDKNGRNRELLSWTVVQKRYFDPEFGGALITDQRNVLATQTSITGFAFLDQARRYSPIVNSVRAEPVQGLGIEWRMDYDPLRQGVTNSSVSANGRLNDVFISVGHTQISSRSVLSPPGNQIQGLVGLGRENRRGWSTGAFAVYDYRVKQLQFVQSQVTYNVDCCGLSVQFRRLNVGTRVNDNQFRIAFSVANIGSFGNLRRQERFF